MLASLGFRGKIQSLSCLACLDEVQLERTRTLELGWPSSFGFLMLPVAVLVAEKANDELLEWRSRSDLNLGYVGKKGPGVRWCG